MNRSLWALYSKKGDKLLEFDPLEVETLSYDSGGFFKRSTFRIDLKDGTYLSVRGVSLEEYQEIAEQIQEAVREARAKGTRR